MVIRRRLGVAASKTAGNPINLGGSKAKPHNISPLAFSPPDTAFGGRARHHRVSNQAFIPGPNPGMVSY